MTQSRWGNRALPIQTLGEHVLRLLRPRGRRPRRGDEVAALDCAREHSERVLARTPADEAATERPVSPSRVPRGRPARLDGAHRCGHLDVKLRSGTRLGDGRLGVEETDRAVALPHDLEQRVERYETPQADLRCSLEEAGDDARAVAAVSTLQRPVEAPWYGEGLPHQSDYRSSAGAATVAMTAPASKPSNSSSAS
jgi:hypothetical protein